MVVSETHEGGAELAPQWDKGQGGAHSSHVAVGLSHHAPKSAAAIFQTKSVGETYPRK